MPELFPYFIAQGANFLANMFNSNLSYRRQNELLDRQNTFTEYMYDKNNEYNRPAEQMARMTDAGISPAAAAQGIAGSPAVSSAPVSSSAPSVAGADLSGFFRDMVSAMRAPSDIANTEANTDKTRIETGVIPIVTEASVNKMKAEAYAAEKRGEYDAEQTRQMVELFPTLKSIKVTELELVKKQVETQLLDLKRIGVEIRKGEKSIELMDKDIDLKESEIEKNQASTRNLDASTDNIEADTEGKGIQNAISHVKLNLAGSGIFSDAGIWTNLLTGVIYGDKSAPAVVDGAFNFAIQAVKHQSNNLFNAGRSFLLDYHSKVKRYSFANPNSEEARKYKAYSHLYHYLYD